MSTADIASLAALIEGLSHVDQEALYGRLVPWVQRWHAFTSSPTALREVCEQRFARGLVCPYCQASKSRRHGTFKDKRGYVKQRFRCGKCSKTFSDLTDTPMAKSRRQALWGKFMGYLIDGLSCRKTAEALGVNHKTVFRWRHKVMDAIRSLEKPNLAGIVESDETYFRQSFKGQRRLRAEAGRAARKRGEAATKRGLSREQVCVVVARDP